MGVADLESMAFRTGRFKGHFKTPRTARAASWQQGGPSAKYVRLSSLTLSDKVRLESLTTSPVNHALPLSGTPSSLFQPQPIRNLPSS